MDQGLKTEENSVDFLQFFDKKFVMKALLTMCKLGP